jgi:hypothetical protein
MMRRLRLSAAVLLLLCATARAHDGGFGHSRRTIFVAATAAEVTVEYRVVMNRDEALAEMALMDTDRDGQVSAKEKETYFTARGKALGALLQVKTADGEAVPLRFAGYSLDQALVQTYRFTLATKERELIFEDRVFPHKPGTVQVRHGSGLKVEQARPANLAHAERVSLRIRRDNP